MNQVQFLKEVDGVIAGMSRDSLAAFVREQAKGCGEKRRGDFLDSLKNAAEGPAGEKDNKAAPGEEDRTAVKGSLLANLEEIENGDIWMDSEFAEGSYDYDYWDEDVPYEFTDESGVIDIVDKAVAFVHDCIDREEYKDAYEVGSVLVPLEIEVRGDFEDYEGGGMCLDDLKEQGLSKINYKHLVWEVLYSAYLVLDESERADAIYEIIQGSAGEFEGMKKFLQKAQDLPDADSFPRAWLECLCRAEIRPSESLLEEAVDLVQDPAFLLGMAGKYCGEHPELYADYLERFGKQEENAYEAGLEAVEKIDSNLRIRSRIALAAARLAQERGDADQAEKCWLEAFRSDTTSVNWLRLFAESRDFSLYEKETEKIVAALAAQKGKDGAGYGYNSSGYKRNGLSDADRLMLPFFAGDIRGLKEKGINENELGTGKWDFDFTEETMAAFMLLLLGGKKMGQSCRRMMYRLTSGLNFTDEAYNAGLAKARKTKDQDLFWVCFLQWREKISLSEQDRREYLAWLSDLVDRRAGKIVGGQLRDRYRDCADDIAALGVVRESLGETGAGQKLLNEYSLKYPRHRSFQKELKAVGMK